MYESPIEKIYGELQTQMVQGDVNTIMKAIRKVEVNVDKEESIKALQYDRNQYTKGYEDGKNEALDKIQAEIEQAFLDDGAMQEYTVEECLRIIDKYKESGE